MATKANDVKGGAGESAGGNGDSFKLAEGVALMTDLMPGESAQEGQRFDSSPEGSQEEPDAAAEVGAGASTEEPGSGGESSSPEEGEEGSSTEGTEAGDTEGTETEGEATEGNEAGEGAEGELSPEAQAAVNARIGEITAKRKEAEEKLTAAETELKELRSKVEQYEADPGSRPKGYVPPIERIDAVRQAREAATKAAQTRELAENYLAGEPEAALAAVREAGVNVSTPEAAVAYLQQLAKKAERAELIAEARREAVEFQASQLIDGERKTLSAQARAAYPWLNNRGSQERRVFDDVVKAYPFLKDDPAFELAIGDMVTGAMARQKAAAAKGKGASPAGPTARGAALPARGTAQPKPKVPGKPSVAAGGTKVGSGGNGSSIRDQAMKDPGNEETRLRLMREFVP